MSELNERRRRALAGLIRSQALSSQEEVAERLSGLGFAVTQATVSRDLDRLGALKIRRDGKLCYALPDQAVPPVAAPSRLATVLRDWVSAILPAGNLLVIKTPPGSAHLVGVELDRSGLPQIVGTICGDDTVFVACGSAADASGLAKTLSAA
ncbi:MAG TPA: hypothetical protein VFK58_06895 [Sphingomicrobium sp.]|nr:hypothetical protein [Sphingomicrobium sp.]